MASSPRSVLLERLLAAVGVLLALCGLVLAVVLGPSGRVVHEARAASGVAVVRAAVLDVSTTAPTVSARADGGDVTLVRLTDVDAVGLTERVRRTELVDVDLIPAGLTTREDGDAALPQRLVTDAFLADPVTGTEPSLEVPEGQLPQGVLVLAGTPEQHRESAVGVTVTWQNAAWFWEALALALAGLALAGWGLRGLLRRRATAPAAAEPGATAATTDDEEQR